MSDTALKDINTMTVYISVIYAVSWNSNLEYTVTRKSISARSVSLQHINISKKVSSANVLFSVLLLYLSSELELLIAALNLFHNEWTLRSY